jgi:A/G-specific adenine glycosylase
VKVGAGVDENEVRQLQGRLLAWFQREGRDFPWRKTTDPYALLLAEKLLQQTRARDAVVEAYKILLAEYPSPESLAVAHLPELEEVIRPLGLVYRAGELKSMATELVERHDGNVPSNLSELMELTGIGSYGARAVLSFGYGVDIPVVDTNVARILYRVFGIPGPMPSNPARKRNLLELADSLIPSGQAREFNLALLDLGSSICTASSPECARCPILTLCEYGQKAVTRT